MYVFIVSAHGVHILLRDILVEYNIHIHIHTHIHIHIHIHMQ